MTFPPEIARALARGGPQSVQVITSNQRAARTLRRAYNHAQQAAGLTQWQPPAILAFDTWTATRWSDLLLTGRTDRVLLNPTQEHAVWRAIIASENTTRSLDSLAEMASDAWSRLILHNGRPRLRDLGVSTDTRAFQRWAQAFDRRCQREKWITQSELPAALQAANLAIPNGLLLVGFDTPPPAYTALFASLPTTHFQPTTESPTLHLATAPDALSEIRAAALWARNLLEQNPSNRIALVVPSLADHKPTLTRILREILAPELEDIAATTQPPYEFSLGVPLASTPLVAFALDLLRWPLQPLPLETISALLLSPFFGASLPTEAPSTAEFDAFVLRQTSMLRPELSLTHLLTLLESSPRRAQLSDLISRLRAVHDLAGGLDLAAELPYAGWADTFRTLLEAARWSRRAREHSHTFQTLQRWESALDELATLDFDGARASAATALRALTRIATQAIFAPESHDAPVQVIGPLEAAGSRFDALWVLGAGELTWPPQSATTPLLPWHLQQELHIPGSDATRDREAAQRLTHRLADSAATVVFSYAAIHDDAHQHPSPLLDTLVLTPYLQPEPTPPRTPLPLETVPDESPLPYLSAGITPGGAQVLQLQAACAFRAFAERRLSATTLETREPGQDARERGNDVHTVMESFWSTVRHQDELKRLTPAEREAILNRAIDHALTRAQRLSQTPWDAAYLTLQRSRLRQLLTPWLDFELTRPPFAVREREEKLHATIGPLHLELRADRIDETEGGDLILDYKTGPSSPSDWLGDRPDAPQLPLYAIQLPPRQLGGVAFALLRAGDDLALKGLATSDTVFAKANKSVLPLESQAEEWRRVLTSLAQDFAAGDSRVDPKRYPHTCKHCDQRLLCRLDLSTFTDLDDTEDDDETQQEHQHG